MSDFDQNKEPTEIFENFKDPKFQSIFPGYPIVINGKTILDSGVEVDVGEIYDHRNSGTIIGDGKSIERAFYLIERPARGKVGVIELLKGCVNRCAYYDTLDGGSNIVYLRQPLHIVSITLMNGYPEISHCGMIEIENLIAGEIKRLNEAAARGGYIEDDSFAMPLIPGIVHPIDIEYTRRAAECQELLLRELNRF